ncbi:MAG: hypothetical protein RLZZ244_282 [Verrucomicrobiota bacterium]
MTLLRLILVLAVGSLCVGCASQAPHRTAQAHAKPLKHGILFEGSY